MAEGFPTETNTPAANSVPAGLDLAQPASERRRKNVFIGRAALFVALVLSSAGVAYAIVRATLLRAPTDPTTERIQQLIDEANRLLAQLDEKRTDS